MLNAHLLFIFGFSPVVWVILPADPTCLPKGSASLVSWQRGRETANHHQDGTIPSLELCLQQMGRPCPTHERDLPLAPQHSPSSLGVSWDHPATPWATLLGQPELPHPKRQQEPCEVPTATGWEFGKEQPPNPPPRCGQRCLQPSPLCVQSAADGAFLIQPRWPCTDADMEQPHGRGTGKEA